MKHLSIDIIRMISVGDHYPKVMLGESFGNTYSVFLTLAYYTGQHMIGAFEGLQLDKFEKHIDIL